MKILIASHNAGKVEEFKALLGNSGYEIESLLDYPDIEEVAETGTTFEENARLKAETIAQRLHQVVIADDSGLMVDALAGAPGVYSARYSGEPKDDDRNNQKLLRELAEIEPGQRTARFVSCIVAAYPGYESLVVEGQVEGTILNQPQGESGFGYDPLFYYPEQDSTFAQMALAEKNKISHRAKAFEKLQEAFAKWLEGLNDEISSDE
ncbi:XTP/dITP diphosphatase [Ignavigranum ruoffiae]|uniref:XTP/dITP diphosphatase n=1 Tax=Ignavigranum ruoffiae TaxID=89093 RepID=UPI0023579716|nr:XTP/dITP diphosphatase [Ignavigranum ruoffiae]